MSNQQSNKTKFIVGILAMTSLAALAPAANAQSLKLSASTENILSRASLNTDSVNKRELRRKLSLIQEPAIKCEVVLKCEAEVPFPPSK